MLRDRGLEAASQHTGDSDTRSPSMDNSRKHDSIGTKTHRTPPSAETPAASSDKPQTSMDHMATSSAEAVEMPNRPHHPVHTGGGGHDDGIVQNTTVVAAAASGQPLLSAATTGGSASAPSSTTATAAAAATSASAPTTTTNSAERALVLVEPKSTAMVLAKPPTAPFTQPPTVSAPPGAASASTSSSKTRPAVFNKVSNGIMPSGAMLGVTGDVIRGGVTYSWQQIHGSGWFKGCYIFIGIYVVHQFQMLTRALILLRHM